jgi:hypothetical protein
MIGERLKRLFKRKEENISVTIHLPIDAVELMKEIAELKGFNDYHTLIKEYISFGLRKDKERYKKNQNV